jgi:hypothetical protein
MSSDSKSSFVDQGKSGPAPDASTGHFDTFETKFFAQGDDGDSAAGEVERFDDLDEPPKAKKFAPSRQLILGVAVASACLAIIGCVALWRGGARARGNTPASAVTEPVSPALTAVQAESAAVPALAAADKPEPAPSVPAVAAASPRPEPTPTLLAEVGVAAHDEPQPAQPVPTEASVAKPEPTPTPVAVRGDDSSTLDVCKKAIKKRHEKAILTACAKAFATDPTAAEIAVALAKTEFDRGHSAQALVWGTKAIAVDPKLADAYVFIGGAEQDAGHTQAAKEAYKRYLDLAPAGRYAGDLRVIVAGL